MSKRVFIVSEQKFPRGTAGANYIEYFALALMQSGWKVVVIGRGKNRTQDRSVNSYIYNGIEYINNESVKPKLHLVDKSADFLVQVENKYHFKKDDYAVIYSSNYWLVRAVIKNFEASRISYINVEELQSYQFKMGEFNINYIMYKAMSKLVHQKVKKTFPISHYLERKDRTTGCNTLCLPIMANPYEYEYITKQKGEVIRFIYPGMKVTGYEDSPQIMISAIQAIKKELGIHIELHITGMKKETVQKWIKRENISISTDTITFHDWLEYPDLVELYKQMDFLLLARKKNAITKANFPSKIPELMSYGVVPVCSDVGDYTKYYLENGVNSIIFESDSEASCREAIRSACMTSNEEYLKMREKSRELVEKRFYYGLWSDKISNFIENKLQ